MWQRRRRHHQRRGETVTSRFRQCLLYISFPVLERDYVEINVFENRSSVINRLGDLIYLFRGLDYHNC